MNRLKDDYMVIDQEKLRSCHKTSEYENASSKYIFTPISYALTWILVRTPATPNQITIFWGLLMIVASIVFMFDNYYLNILGGVGWVIAYALDYCDGDIARYKNLKSKRGMYQDLVNHRATYPLLMFCIGFGQFIGGRTGFLGICIDPHAYLILGFLAGICMVLIMDLGDIYNRSYPEKAIDSDEGSAAVEGGNVSNKKLFRLIMNINPLTFTNMKILIPIFAIVNLMDLFILFYGIFYPIATFFRYITLYRRIPGVQKS